MVSLRFGALFVVGGSQFFARAALRQTVTAMIVYNKANVNTVPPPAGACTYFETVSGTVVPACETVTEFITSVVTTNVPGAPSAGATETESLSTISNISLPTSQPPHTNSTTESAAPSTSTYPIPEIPCTETARAGDCLSEWWWPQPVNTFSSRPTNDSPNIPSSDLLTSTESTTSTSKPSLHPNSTQTVPSSAEVANSSPPSATFSVAAPEHTAGTAITVTETSTTTMLFSTTQTEEPLPPSIVTVHTTVTTSSTVTVRTTATTFAVPTTVTTSSPAPSTTIHTALEPGSVPAAASEPASSILPFACTGRQLADGQAVGPDCSFTTASTSASTPQAIRGPDDDPWATTGLLASMPTTRMSGSPLAPGGSSAPHAHNATSAPFSLRHRRSMPSTFETSTVASPQLSKSESAAFTGAGTQLQAANIIA